MSIALEDVLDVNFVVAGVRMLQELDHRERFAQRVGADVDTDLISDPVMPLPGLTPSIITPSTEFQLSLQKERIVVSVTSNTTVRRRYSDYNGLERLAKVAHLAIECSEMPFAPVQAYGCNVTAVYSQDESDSSSDFVATKLFPGKLAQLGDTPIRGGSGQVIYQEGERTWAFRVEPRANDVSGRRIYMNLNLHVDKQLMPSEDAIWKNLQLAWRSTELFAQILAT